MKPAHTRITLSGIFGDSATSIVEQWSFSLGAASDAAISGGTDAQLVPKATALIDAYVTHLKPHMPANTWLTKTTIAAVGADGKIPTRADGSYVQGTWATAHAGAMAASSMPLQVALCVGLVTARSGPTGKGRFFLPFPALSLATSDRRIPTNQLDPVVTAVAAFLGAVNDIPGVNLGVVSSKGYISDVTGIRIGRVPDTMRSRREDVAEGYLAAAVPQ